jgi:hypothetical protein
MPTIQMAFNFSDAIACWLRETKASAFQFSDTQSPFCINGVTSHVEHIVSAVARFYALDQYRDFAATSPRKEPSGWKQTGVEKVAHEDE